MSNLENQTFSQLSTTLSLNTTDHNQTVEPINWNKKELTIPNEVIIPLIVLLVLIVCGYIIYKRYQKRNSYSPINFQSPKSIATTPIQKALVIIIGIGEYQTYKKNSDEDDTCQQFLNLPVEKDVENLRQLFNFLQYTILPKEDDKLYNTTYWNEQKLKTFLGKAGEELVSVDEDGKLKYDALICAVSCHGIPDHIVTSDYKAVQKTAIHRFFSLKYKKSREIPRIFIFDCCEGDQIRIETDEKDNEKTETNDIEKRWDLEHPDLKNTTMWTSKEPNPDYKLVEINASNTSFAARCNAEIGSYLLHGFVKKVRENYKHAKKETLGRTFEKIQNELHQKGIQQTTHVFNNETQYLILEKRNASLEAVGITIHTKSGSK